jgi:hypothetical protein
LQFGEGKKKGVKGTKGFSLEKLGPTHHNMREKITLNSPYLENRFQQLAKLDRKNSNFFSEPPTKFG